MNCECISTSLKCEKLIYADWSNFQDKKSLLSCDVQQAFEQSENITTVVQLENKALFVGEVKGISFLKKTKFLPVKFSAHFPKLIALHAESIVLGCIQSNTFLGFYELEVLYLNNNSISIIEDGAFKDLTKLRVLFLDHNQIVSLGKEPFTKVLEFKIFTLYSNPIMDSNDMVSIAKDLNFIPKATLPNMTSFVKDLTTKLTNYENNTDKLKAQNQLMIYITYFLAFLVIDLTAALIYSLFSKRNFYA